MSSSEFDLAAARESFEVFLFEMDDRVEGLKRVAEERGFALDLSLASLSGLERFVIEMMDGPTSPVDAPSLIVTCGRYLGETMRENYGGRWELPLHDPRNVHFNEPVIVGHTRMDIEFAPLMLARAFARKRTGGMFERAIRNQIEPERLDLSDLIGRDRRGA